MYFNVATFVEHLVLDNPRSVDGESAHFALRLLWRFSESISNAIVSPDVMAGKLYLKQLISHSVYQAAISQSRSERDRCKELLKEVYDGILSKFVSFEDFLETLQELPQVGTLPDVITLLQAERGKINWNIQM